MAGLTFTIKVIPKDREPDPRLLEIMSDVGTQLGRVADRMAARQALLFGAQRRCRAPGSAWPITKTIVEGHGGEITVASTPGHGTTFTIRIPRVRPLWL